MVDVNATSTAKNEVTIVDVRSNYNLQAGLVLRGQGITVKDSTSSYNTAGISLFGVDYPAMVQFEGIVSCHHNAMKGIMSGSFGGIPMAVNVEGVLNTYLNTFQGLAVFFSELDFNVEKDGSFNSCQNGADILIVDGAANFSDTGTDGYTCDSEDIPECMPCPQCN